MASSSKYVSIHSPSCFKYIMPNVNVQIAAGSKFRSLFTIKNPRNVQKTDLYFFRNADGNLAKTLSFADINLELNFIKVNTLAAILDGAGLPILLSQ